MPQANPFASRSTPVPKVGVGLRHPHYREALTGDWNLDFIEVHTENFFAEGGLTRVFLEDIRSKFSVSFHGTAMGLGSAVGISTKYLQRLKALVDEYQPLFVSDHLCFAWGGMKGNQSHAGDLLPLPFNEETLSVLIDNVRRVQDMLGRQLLVENIVSYINLDNNTISEAEFITALVERAECGLLVDLNNILVNARNRKEHDPIRFARNWLRNIPANAVVELHLAGYTPPVDGGLIIDDHSQPINDECWSLYKDAMELNQNAATLVEWDNDLPAWHTLVAEADKARLYQRTEPKRIEAST
ncbi:DUF692 domain-containing protein [Teredinibacter turnerae]|uniref:DUF692 domain-containing protein n=1 Tax=Teredinibacter turnerae TaxID=2426 RepID=UPI00037E2E3A|nr:DUF692 domain-containing protein [Teredinibacter turnerae]